MSASLPRRIARTMRRHAAGSRVIPATRWTAPTRWSPRPVTWVPLLLGLWLFGTGEALLVEAGIGNTPWVVLAQGLGLRTGLTIGWATFVISAAVLLAWIPLRERPGLGTIANAVVIATAIDVMLPILPAPDSFQWQLVQVLAGIASVGAGSALYLTAGLGPGPRDGLMTSLHHRWGVPVGRVRLAIEVVVLLAGWLLGGTVGIGTAMFALLIGRSVAIWLAVAARVAGIRRSSD